MTDVLHVARLEASDVTATVHTTDRRSTLELFVSSGRLLLYVATANSLEPPGVRSVWTLDGARSRVLVGVGTLAADTPLPLITFWHRRRQVSGQLHRLGPFWLAEASGPRLRLMVDDGTQTTVARSRRRSGPVPASRHASRLSAGPVPPLPHHLESP